MSPRAVFNYVCCLLPIAALSEEASYILHEIRMACGFLIFALRLFGPLLFGKGRLRLGNSSCLLFFLCLVLVLGVMSLLFCRFFDFGFFRPCLLYTSDAAVENFDSFWRFRTAGQTGPLFPGYQVGRLSKFSGINWYACLPAGRPNTNLYQRKAGHQRTAAHGETKSAW